MREFVFWIPAGYAVARPVLCRQRWVIEFLTADGKWTRESNDCELHDDAEKAHAIAKEHSTEENPAWAITMGART